MWIFHGYNRLPGRVAVLEVRRRGLQQIAILSRHSVSDWGGRKEGSAGLGNGGR